uniref:Uncharacterized protein n=1 Tax=Globodera rostochiensis TaxID=31243 RepID=A0A914I6V4_GLORO
MNVSAGNSQQIIHYSPFKASLVGFEQTVFSERAVFQFNSKFQQPNGKNWRKAALAQRNLCYFFLHGILADKRLRLFVRSATIHLTISPWLNTQGKRREANECQIKIYKSPNFEPGKQK